MYVMLCYIVLSILICYYACSIVLCCVCFLCFVMCVLLFCVLCIVCSGLVCYFCFILLFCILCYVILNCLYTSSRLCMFHMLCYVMLNSLFSSVLPAEKTNRVILWYCLGEILTYLPTGHLSSSAVHWSVKSTLPKNVGDEYTAIPEFPVTSTSYPGTDLERAGGEEESCTRWIPSKASITESIFPV